MSKKSFKNTNPALNFITPPEAVEPLNTSNYTGTNKKTAQNGTERLKKNPEYVEVKSKRVQLLLQPSVVKKVKQLAKKKKTSMNELINIAIQEYLEKEM